MNIARKSLAWTLIFSAVMWTACGKDEAKNKTKPTSDKSGTQADLAKLDATAEGNARSELQGVYLISASKPTDKVVKNLAVTIVLKAETSGTVTAILECDKSNARGQVTAEYAFEATGKKISIKPTSEPKTDITSRDTKSGFDKGECAVSLKTGVFEYVAGNTLEVSQNGRAIPGSPFCRMIKSDDGGLTTDTACKDQVKMKTKFESIAPAAPTTAPGTTPESTSGSGNSPSASSTRPGSTATNGTIEERLKGYFESTLEVVDGVKVRDQISISKETVKIIRYCVVDNEAPVSVTAEAKIKLSDKDYEVLEGAKQEADLKGDKKCTLEIKQGAKSEIKLENNDTVLTITKDGKSTKFKSVVNE